jgi:hypothetical protein
MKKNILYFSLTAFFFVFQIASAIAQCPMCKATAESAIREGSQKMASLNDGILYLFFIPYLLIGAVGYVWYRNYKRFKREEAARVASESAQS